jgi:hypothetical protein
VARTFYRGPTIVSARVAFKTRQEISGGRRSEYRNTLLHEMGHVMGLGHSPSDHDVMRPQTGSGSKEAHFQEGEATCLRMMYLHRKAGNLPPDRDVALGAAAAAVTRTVVIVD